MDILSLPDDCLRLIFDLCPLQSLLPLKRVSTRFYDLITSICTTKGSLKIFGSPFELQQYIQSVAEHYVEDVPELKVNPILDNVLILKQSDSDSVYRIPECFPSITNLFIGCHSFPNLDLERLLAPWVPHLTSFSLYELPGNLVADPASFWPTLNAMESLQKLHICITSHFHFPDNLTIISQLRQFALTKHPFDLVPVLSHISNDIFLVLSFVHFNVDVLERLVRANPAVTKSIVGIDLGYFYSNENRVTNFSKVFAFICERFREIWLMDLMFGEHIPLTELIPGLGKLSKLTELRIYIGRDQLPADPNQLYRFKQCTSVRHLYIEVFGLSLAQFWYWIPGLFPCIKAIRIKGDLGVEEDEEVMNAFVERAQREFKFLEKWSFN